MRDQTVLPDSVLEEWRGLDALYFGAIGTPEVPPGIVERGLILKMRFELDLYVNLRPFKLKGQNTGQNTGQAKTQDIDFMVVRENTEGTYAGEGGFLRKNTQAEVATQGSVNTRMGVERCIRFACDLASSRPRQNITLVHKTNVLTFAGDLWERTFNEVTADFPQLETSYNHVDAACIHMVADPQRYDIIVTDNLFGDILTDLGGAVSGGIGRAASANLNPDRTGPSMFEPVHGSAPDIAGQGIADPTAAILSGAMMLDFLGATEAAAKIQAACDQVLSEQVTVRNLAGNKPDDKSIDKPADTPAKTKSIGDAIAAAIR